MRPYRSWVEVSRGQIAANYRAVRAATGPEVELMPVVKADAYRHGAVEVSRVLEQEGARWLAVSNTDEGIALREAGITARILVMADFLPFTRRAMLDFDLTPVLHHIGDLAALESLAAQRGARAACHLKLDTGMGRLGTRATAEEIARAAAVCSYVAIEGLMTHFASSANYSSPQTGQQLAKFREVAAELAARGIRPRWIHASSSNPVVYGRTDAFGNMVRPGHVIYGYVSPVLGKAPARVVEVKPALAWKTTVLAVKNVPAGAQIGYGGIFRAEREMRIAILAAGYADGVPHRLSNKGRVIARGHFAPIVGAVSMDVMTIDASEVPELQVGDAVTLLGAEGELAIDAQEMARTAGTISYAVLCGISARVKRVFL